MYQKIASRNWRKRSRSISNGRRCSSSRRSNNSRSRGNWRGKRRPSSASLGGSCLNYSSIHSSKFDDNDGDADCSSNDDDGDGILTILEGTDQNFDGNPSDSRDSDLDGIYDYIDFDDDNDGWSDYAEQQCLTISTDASSVPDDSDGDGICDLNEDDDGGLLPGFGLLTAISMLSLAAFARRD